jgi:very-short-patch-repair endonuclease
MVYIPIIMKTDQEKIKHDYIMQNLLRGFGKPIETFVISSFCLDIRLQNIKPIFQYAIQKAHGNSSYLYDLYYPKLNAIVEVDEEHHETSREEDSLKETYAISKLSGLHFFRIRFHESHSSVIDQIEQVKLKLLEVVAEKGIEDIKWVENQFDAEMAIQEYSKTLIISISRNKSITSLLDFPLQIPERITSIRDLTLVYLTGNTGTVAGVYTVQPEDWLGKGTGNLKHTGAKNPQHSILQSGSTFYRKSTNILYSKDLNLR